MGGQEETGVQAQGEERMNMEAVDGVRGAVYGRPLLGRRSPNRVSKRLPAETTAPRLRHFPFNPFRAVAPCLFEFHGFNLRVVAFTASRGLETAIPGFGRLLRVAGRLFDSARDGRPTTLPPRQLARKLRALPASRALSSFLISNGTLSTTEVLSSFLMCCSMRRLKGEAACPRL